MHTNVSRYIAHMFALLISKLQEKSSCIWPKIANLKCSLYKSNENLRVLSPFPVPRWGKHSGGIAPDRDNKPLPLMVAVIMKLILCCIFCHSTRLPHHTHNSQWSSLYAPIRFPDRSQTSRSTPSPYLESSWAVCCLSDASLFSYSLSLIASGK